MRKNKKKKHLVYHYCSLESFMAIIQNKSIRLTDINKTNDYMEKKWIAKYLDGIIDEQLKENGIFINLDEECSYDDYSKTHREYFINSIEEFICNADPILVACFSDNGDLLSQWRAYASDGKGFAIGFDEDLLDRLNRHNSRFYQPVNYAEITYDEDIQKSEVRNIIKENIDAKREMYSSTSMGKSFACFEDLFYEEFDAFCDDLTEGMSFASCFYKNPAFQEEEESRIVYDPEILTDINDVGDSDLSCYTNHRKKGKFSFSPIKHQIKGNRIVSYSDLSFKELIKDEIIAEIIIGPKSEIKESDLICFLAANGYHVGPIEIKKSAATYR